MAEKIYLKNIPSMTVQKLVEDLSDAYCSLIKNGEQVKMMPSVMLWGSPGIGKSQAIRQIAENIEIGTGKKTAITDVRLLLFNPIDLRGIPTANEDGEKWQGWTAESKCRYDHDSDYADGVDDAMDEFGEEW